MDDCDLTWTIELSPRAEKELEYWSDEDCNPLFVPMSIHSVIPNGAKRRRDLGGKLAPNRDPFSRWSSG